MANKYDLVTVVKNQANGLDSAVYSVGGLIPAGKTRFLTYLKIERGAQIESSTVTGVTAVVASAAISAPGLQFATSMSTPVLSLILPGMAAPAAADSDLAMAVSPMFGEVHIPNTPNMEHPIAKIAGSASTFMVIGIGQSAPPLRIFAQYYDE